MNNPYSLLNKKILVTEAGGEIGRQIAIECVKLGASVIIQDKDSKLLSDTESKLTEFDYTSVVCDIETEDGIDLLVSSCPKLDGVSFNSVVSTTLLLKFININTINKVLNTNVVGPVLLLQRLIKNKKINKHASVVFLSSVSGVYTVHYADSLNAMSNGAISAFVKGAALDLAAQGIRVNSVNPSVIETAEMLSSSILTEDELNEKRNYFPLKRFGKPIDVALPVIYLLSDASSWITGVHMPIDGGYTLL